MPTRQALRILLSDRNTKINRSSYTFRNSAIEQLSLSQFCMTVLEVVKSLWKTHCKHSWDMKHTFVDSALQQRMTLDVTQKLVFPGGTSSIELTCQCRRYRRHRRCWFDSWVGKILWREARQPTLVFLPGESHGLRNLESYHHKELDVIEAT